MELGKSLYLVFMSVQGAGLLQDQEPLQGQREGRGRDKGEKAGM